MSLLKQHSIIDKWPSKTLLGHSQPDLFYIMQRIKRTKYKEMIDFLYKMQASMVLYSKEKYNKQINPQINVSLANSKTCSRYKNYDFSIDYNIRHYTKSFFYRDDIDSDRFMFTEYKHIEQDPVIGSIKGNWK